MSPYKHQNLQMVGFKLNKYVYFSPLEVVDRGSETQPQVVGTLNKITQQDKG